MTKKGKPTDALIQHKRELVGETLRSYREKTGFSQDQLADIMGVHRSTISKIETGKFSITIDYLEKFAWYLDFEIKLIKT